MRIEINTFKRNPAAVPDMNVNNSCGPKTLRWGEDSIISVLHKEDNPPFYEDSIIANKYIYVYIHISIQIYDSLHTCHYI